MRNVRDADPSRDAAWWRRTDTRPGERLQKAMENGHRNSEFPHEKW